MPKELKAGIGKKGEVWFETIFPANGKIWTPQAIRDFIPSGEEIKVIIKKKKNGKSRS